MADGAGKLRPLHEGQAVLRHQDPARGEAALAVAIELGREQYRARADGVGGIHQDGVERLALAPCDPLARLAHIAGAIGDDHPAARILEGACRDLREMRAAHVDHGGVDLAQHRLLDRAMAQHLAQHAPIAAANDEHPARRAMGEERHMRHHLVIDELVPRCELHHPVEHHHAAELGILENDEMLMRGAAFMQDALRLQADAPALMQGLVDPALQSSASRPRRCSVTVMRSGVKARSITPSAACGSVPPHMKMSMAA